MGFHLYKYCKFWSVSLGHFIKHKRLISEECVHITYVSAFCTLWFFLKHEPVWHFFKTLTQHYKIVNGHFFATAYWPDSPASLRICYDLTNDSSVNFWTMFFLHSLPNICHFWWFFIILKLMDGSSVKEAGESDQHCLIKCIAKIWISFLSSSMIKQQSAKKKIDSWYK